MSMAHAQCALLPAKAILHEAHTNNEIDSVDCGTADDESKVHMRKSKFRTLRHDHSNTLLQNSELSPKKSFQYPDLDTDTSLSTSDLSQGRKRFSDFKNSHSGETTKMPILLISEASCDNTLFDHDRTAYNRCSVQKGTEEIKTELLQAGCQIDNPDSGIERTPVVPNHTHFNFSHSPEPTVSIPLSTYFNLLTTHSHTSHSSATRDTGTACCRCQSCPGVVTAFPSASADLQELGLSKGQSDHYRDRRVQSEAGFLKHQMKTLIEGRVYDEDVSKLQKKRSHLYHHSPSSPPETVKSHHFSPKILSYTLPCSKDSDDLFNDGPKLATHPMHNSKYSDDLYNNGPKLSDDLLNNGPKLSDDLLNNGPKLSDDLLNNGPKLSDDLFNNGPKRSDDLLNNGPKLSDDLLNNGPKLSDDLFNNGPKLSSHTMPNNSTSSFQVNSFHLPSPSLISKSSFDQLTKELLRAKEIRKSLEEENEKLRQVQTNSIQTSEEVVKLLSVKSSLEKKVNEQGCEIRVLNETIQKLQRKLIIKKGNTLS